MSAALVSDFNLQRINTKEFAEHISATIDFGGNLLAIARRGTGKTTIAQQTIKDKKHKEVYMNLSIMERPDIGGYPNFFASKNGAKFINFLMPSIFQSLMEGDEPCVAILDEVDKADSTLLAPLLEFIQFRTVNGHPLKNLKATILTGNLPGESGERPPLPLLDRVEKFLVEVSPQLWLDWGSASGAIHPSISAYIADNVDELCGEIDRGSDVFGDKSPRSWHAASKMITYGEQNGWRLPLIQQKVAACVGKEAGLKYSSFFEHYQVILPLVDRIINGEDIGNVDKLEHTKRIVICMVLCSRFAAVLDKISLNNNNKNSLVLDEQAKIISKNVAKFLLDSDPDMALISIKGQLSQRRVLDFNLHETQEWDQILENLINHINE